MKQEKQKQPSLPNTTRCIGLKFEQHIREIHFTTEFDKKNNNIFFLFQI